MSVQLRNEHIHSTSTRLGCDLADASVYERGASFHRVKGRDRKTIEGEGLLCTKTK